MTTDEDWRGALAGLITLGKIGVEIMFAVKNAVAVDIGTQGQAKFYGVFHGFFVEHRQSAGVRQRNGRYMRIGSAAVLGTIGAKKFCFRA